MNPPLTPEEEQYIYDWLEKKPMPEQDQSGIDLGQLRENLKLTPLERLYRHKRLRQSGKCLSNTQVTQPEVSSS